MNEEKTYEQWIANRRSIEPPADLVENVMSALEQQQTEPVGRFDLLWQINESSLFRCAACVAAMLIGSFPFLVAAWVSKMIVF